MYQHGRCPTGESIFFLFSLLTDKSTSWPTKNGPTFLFNLKTQEKRAERERKKERSRCQSEGTSSTERPESPGKRIIEATSTAGVDSTSFQNSTLSRQQRIPSTGFCSTNKKRREKFFKLPFYFVAFDLNSFYLTQHHYNKRTDNILSLHRERFYKIQCFFSTMFLLFFCVCSTAR